MKTLQTFLLACFFVSSFFTSFAQDSVSNKRMVQFTFIYPIGTNGLESGTYESNFSFNYIAGYNKSVTGFEYGGFANNLTGDLTGIQVSGFSNVVLGKTLGCQISGFSNYAHKSFKGAQISGFSNVIKDSAYVSQISGYSNVIIGKSIGTQISGFSNVITDSSTSIQISGFSNVVKGSNIGSQISGFSNVTTGSIKGSQIAAFANISKDITGAQISGFVNVAKTLNGVQIGFLNYADSVEKGMPIGFLSIVRKGGYKSIGFEYNETGFTQAELCLGVPRFYNIFTMGTNFFIDYANVSFGYGIGSQLFKTKKFQSHLQVTNSSITVYETNMFAFNSLTTGKLQAAYSFTESFQVFGGISMNALVTTYKNENNQYSDYGLHPWKTNRWEENGYLIQTYPGVHVGVRAQL